MNQNNALLKPKREFDARDNKNPKVKSIIDSTIYGKKIENQLLDLYFLVLWKGYIEEKSTWKSSVTIMHL